MPKNDATKLQLNVRQYSDNYLSLELTWTADPDCPSPLCIVCGEKLASSAMAPAELKQHLTTRYLKLADKNEQYFRRQLTSNKTQKATLAKRFKVSDKAREASYAVAEIVAKKMQSRTIAETVYLPVCQKTVKIMFGEDAVSDINKIPLLYNTISRRIADLHSDIEATFCQK